MSQQTMLAKENIYRCYSVPLMRFLKSRGHRFIDVAMATGTYSRFFMYQLTSKLHWIGEGETEVVLQQWRDSSTVQIWLTHELISGN
jgi:hypothetical protein